MINGIFREFGDFGKFAKLKCANFNVKNAQGVVEIWLRMSGQIYNTLEDYKRLGQYILELSKQ